MGKIKKKLFPHQAFIRVGVSAAISVVILIADYFVSNWLSYLFDDSSTLALIRHLASSTINHDSEDIILLNCGYDKQLVAVRDECGDSIGCEVVSDRRTLLTLLDIAKKSEYRYMFLDIRFDKGLESDLDSMLFSKIKLMPRIVISTHWEDDGYEIADSGLKAKSGYADYLSTYFSGFSRYGYLQQDSLSVALKIYSDVDGGDIVRKGPFYFSGGKLCNNMQFIIFKENDVIDGDDLLSRYPPLGGEVLAMLDSEDIAEMMNGKIVVVGDMVHDIHPTYAGDVPGPLLNIRAYEALRDGRHVVDWHLIYFLFIVYGLCAYFVLYSQTLQIPVKMKNYLFRIPLIVFILLNIGWGCVMFILKLVVFYFYGASVIFAIPTFVFSILSMPYSYSEFKKNNKMTSKLNTDKIPSADE